MVEKFEREHGYEMGNRKYDINLQKARGGNKT
jgi:hypothetical protein